MPIAWPAAHATCPSDAWVSARYRYRWWKAAFRLGTGFVAASLLLVEQLVRSLRAPFWLKIRTVNVLLCCVWAVVFAPVGGLADLMASAPILASCDGGGDFVMQEIRMHPAVLLLLFAGPVLELPYVHVGIAATMTGATELALALAAHLHGNLFVVFDHVGVTLMRTLASGSGLLLRSALTFEAVSACVCADSDTRQHDDGVQHRTVGEVAVPPELFLDKGEPALEPGAQHERLEGRQSTTHEDCVQFREDGGGDQPVCTCVLLLGQLVCSWCRRCRVFGVLCQLA